jgi:hypothetical protein
VIENFILYCFAPASAHLTAGTKWSKTVYTGYGRGHRDRQGHGHEYKFKNESLIAAKLYFYI